MSIDVQSEPSTLSAPVQESNGAAMPESSVSIEASVPPEGGGNNTQWYECQTRVGVVQLGFDVDATSAEVLLSTHQVLKQGTLLADHELLVEAVELWQDIQLDPEPIPFNVERSCIPAAIYADITPRDVPGLSTLRLALSATALPDLKPREQTLSDHLDFSWSAYPCTLGLSALFLDAAEVAALAPGAVVLLAESYRELWQMTISLHDVPVLAIADLNLTQRRLSIQQVLHQSSISAADQHNNKLEIELTSPLLLDIGKCLGFSGAMPDLDTTWDQDAMRLRLNGEIVGSGYLIRVGDGYGLCVTEFMIAERDG